MLLGLVLLLGAFIVYFDLIQPAYQDAQATKATELGLSRFLSVEKEAVTKVQNLVSSYKGEGQVQGAVSAALPLQADDPGALAQIYGLAQNSGLSLLSVSVSVKNPQPPVNAGPASPGAALIKPTGMTLFQVKLVGPYDGLKAFLSRLETNMRIFDLVSLTLQTNAGGAGKASQATYSYDMVIATYYQLPS